MATMPQRSGRVAHHCGRVGPHVGVDEVRAGGDDRRKARGGEPLAELVALGAQVVAQRVEL